MEHNIERIGIISDTHGKILPGIQNIFKDVDLIIHCGDIGPIDIFKKLQEIAPVEAVLGNTDNFIYYPDLKKYRFITINGLNVLVQHEFNPKKIKKTIMDKKVDIILYGHTHMPFVKKEDGVLYLNPGSATQGRGGFPPSAAIVSIINGEAVPEIIELA